MGFCGLVSILLLFECTRQIEKGKGRAREREKLLVDCADDEAGR